MSPHEGEERSQGPPAATHETFEALARPEAYPQDPTAAEGVEWIQTHISHVYRTGAWVYKLRKPVDLGFVRFAERSERNEDCLREVALNRRLAPDVYRGVAPLLGSEARPQIGPVAEGPPEPAGGAPPELCVVMRRLPDGRDALSLLQAGRLAEGQLDALAALVAGFHARHGLGRPTPFTPEDWRARCTEPAEQNFRTLSEADDDALVPPDLLATARERERAFVASRADRFEARRVAGRAVDAHGDLHLQHVWFESDDSPPIVIDCLEFNERLRQIDAAAEVAFPAMDLRYRGRIDWAERFLRHYARASDDFDLYSVVDYFEAYRAGVRAKVASLAARDPEIEPQQRDAAAESTRRHLTLAAEALAPPRPGTLVLTAGIVGTGKSSVARALAERLEAAGRGAVVVASDRVRKRILGIAPTERAGGGWSTGAYAPEKVALAYHGLFDRARPVLGSGRTAILDATFSRRNRRAEARALAEALGCRVFLVETVCQPEETRARLARRAAEGADPSDAGPETYEPSVRSFEAPDEWPEGLRAVVHTDRKDWRAAAADVADRIARLDPAGV